MIIVILLVVAIVFSGISMALNLSLIELEPVKSLQGAETVSGGQVNLVVEGNVIRGAGG